MVTASAANFGFRRAIPQMLGITLGFGLMVMAAGFGLAGLFHAEPRLHTMLKYAGATYLLYLAWRIARADAASRNAGAGKADQLCRSRALHVDEPQGLGDRGGRAGSLHHRRGRRVAANLGDRGVLAVTCLASVAIWAGFGVAIARFLASPRARMAFNWSMAGLLVLSLIPVFW